MIYLDNAASTIVDESVLNSYQKVCLQYYANASALHNFSNSTNNLLNSATDQIKDVLALTNHQITYTSGATEAINTIIKGLPYAYPNRNKIVVTTAIEHPSVENAVKHLVVNHGYEHLILELDENGYIKKEGLKAVLSLKPTLLSITHVNSEIGLIEDYQEIYKLANEAGVLMHLDIAQSLGKIAIDFDYVDYASASMHKINGLKGSGILINKKSCTIYPLIHGGEQQLFRSGTIPVDLAIACSKAIRIAIENDFNYICDLSSYVKKSLLNLDDIIINSHEGCSPYIINFSISNVDVSSVVRLLSEKEIYVSTKTACKDDKALSKTVFAMSKDESRAINSVRCSISKYNSKEEIDVFVEVLQDAIAKVRGNICG